MLKTLLFSLLLLHLSASAQLYTRSGDQGDGTYANPVLPGDYSDLDAIKVGKFYYAISSTMQFSPGMLVLRSEDLVNWEMIGHVVSDLTQISPALNWDKMDRYGRGVWAGSIRYYNNKFWVYFGTPDEGFFMSSATDPAGLWEPLHQLWNVKGWDDCCSFQDEDGQLYFIATNFARDPRNGKEYNIHLFKMSPDGKQLIMESDSILYQAKGSEANKLYKINGYYYHFFSQVNEQGQRYCMMGRATNIWGPYTHRAVNKVDRKKDREPNQGALLEAGKGNWYFFTHHGRGDWEGRPASLLPVTWVDGWPLLGAPSKDSVGEMVWSGKKPIKTKPRLRIQTTDEFNSTKLSVQWEWNYQPRNDKWSLSQRKGFMRLYAFRPLADSNAVLLRTGNILTQRSMRKEKNEVVVKIQTGNMSDGQVAGLTHFSTAGNSALSIKKVGPDQFLVYTIDGRDSIIAPLTQKQVWLRSTWDINGLNRYAYSLDNRHFTTLSAISFLKWGSYRGDRIGLYTYNTGSEGGFIDVDYFRYGFTGMPKGK